MKCFFLAVYVPESHRDSLKQALFQAGAGKIGNYDSCCWETEGTGQFRPLPGSHPFLGSQDRLEHAPEWKIELVVPADKIKCASGIFAKGTEMVIPSTTNRRIKQA